MSNSSSYQKVIKKGLKLKKASSTKPKRAVHEEIEERLGDVTAIEPDAIISGKEAADAEEEIDLPELRVATEENLTAAEKSFRLVQLRRERERAQKKLELSHRQRIEKFNAQLAALSEHFDIPKVGPG
eukprot:GHVO01069127.1.p1 GENE.GHVO01069127.1~~GHVO01069127.1.p1  ORF type:complete len:128 (+),score=24.78 GHVO01069127.1:147-530(+)